MQPSGSSGKRILIIDDMVSVVMVMKTMLEMAGYEVDSATSGQEAIIRARGWPPDLILMDINLPDITGFRLATELKKSDDTQHIPLVAMSGEYRQEDVAELRDAGFLDQLEKPVKFDRLVQVISRIIG